MKKRNLFLTLGLALGLGVGVAAGLGARGLEAKEVGAAVPEYVYLDWTNSNWAKWNPSSPSVYAYFMNSSSQATGSAWRGNVSTTTVVESGTTYYKFAVPANSAKVVFSFTQNGWNNTNNHQTVDLTIPTDGKDCFALDNGSSSGEGEKYDGTWSVFGGVKYTVTRLAVEFVNGEAQSPADWDLDNELIPEGEAHAVPGKIYKNLEHFVGWYTNPACTSSYTGTASVNANFTIYAKYERLTVNSYIYWIAESMSPVFDHFYAFNEYNTAEWPGDEIDGYEVHGSMHFNGLEQKIYKIPVPSNAEFKFILNNNNNKQTVDIDTITLKAGYYTWLEGGETKYSYSVNADAGAALDFLLEAEEFRNATRQASGAPADYSICGIAPSDAADLYEAYEDLSDGATAMVNNTTTYTYDGTDTSTQVDVYYSAIMAELYKIALKDNDFKVSHSSLIVLSPSANNSNSFAILIILTTSLSLVAVGSIFVIRRRKENN